MTALATYEPQGIARASDPGQAPALNLSIDEVGTLAENIAASKLFPGIETKPAAFALMMLCQSEGLHPMQAVRRFHIIKGRPTMRADAMQAEFQRQGGKVRWIQSDTEVCEANFMHPAHSPEPGIPVRFTVKDAEVAGLFNNALWSRFPRQMLRARVISEGVRMILPGVVVGIYTPEEADDFEPGQAAPIPPPASQLVRTQGPAPLPAPKPAENVILGAFNQESYDPRPYHQVVDQELEHAAKLCPALDLKAPQVHQHILKRAAELGHATKPEGSLKLKIVLEANQDLYQTHRDWVRSEIGDYIHNKAEEAQAAAQAKAEPREQGQDG